MVNERRDNNLDGELIVNSASLEDVAPNETSNTRAHSVTSIHTVSDPNTPTYEELQTKLETSNRNIQNIKDQQQHLYRLQQAAKQHLVDMENIRNQTRFRPNAMNRRREDGTPDYDSVEQVHDDMTSLVNRMKTLQTLIQGQHELSALLGDDGPEVMAEQEALQRKLDDLKIQRQDMKNLVSELQEISNVAEKTAQAQQQQSQQHNIDEPRNVPIEYQRVVPIELVGAAKGTNTTGQQNKPIHNGHCEHHNGTHNGSLASNSDISDELNVENTLEDENPEMVAETTDLIRQKMADINAMKNQLKRLKDMMETVKIIEEKTAGKSVKDIGNEDISEESINKQKHANRNSGLATLLTAPGTDQQNDCTAEEEEMSEKVRMLHEMTEDLREQARQMSSERERLKAIKDEIKRRREVVEKSSSRENSISRSISHTNSNLNNEAEKHLLEAEYEAKKKEFEKLCQRLQEEDTVEDEKIDDVQEDDETRQTEKQETPPQQYNRDNWRCSNVASIPSINSCKGQSSEAGMTPLRGKDSADSGAADVHGQPSIEAASFKSGSSRSYSVPPPMRAINNREMPWRKNSQDNTSSQFSHFIAPLPPPHPQQPGGVPSNWNPAYYYSTPYAQQCSPHFHSGGTGDCCTHQCHPNSTLNASNQQHVTSSMSNDPVLLQQFIQTQQMLINSVSQCNQLLWHQQKEINNLNNAVLLLQERLLNSNDINLSRAESVPNPVVANTFCLQQSSRAQSEQPHSYPQQQQQQQQSIQQQPPMSPIRNYHAQSHNIFHQYRRNITTAGCNHMNCCGNSSTNTSYNNFANEQQHVPPTQSTNQNFLNNDIPPNSTGPAGPIFMHHHNNTITPMQAPPPPQQQQQQQQHNPHHLNNSNILNSQQNCLNSPNPNVTAVAAATSSSSGPNNINSVPTNTSNNAAVAAASALNNQVPPGNRANNYWDNFRSYSRQNLLSSNSCKSNEEQNHHYQQMNPSSSSLFGQNLLSSSSSSMTNQNLNGFRNLYQQQGMNNNCGTSTNSNNNVNGIISNLDSITKFRNQFNNINCIEQQQQQQQPHENSLHNIQSQQQQQQQQQQSQEQNLLNTINNGENIPSSSSNMENFEQQTTNTTATMNVIQNSNLQNFNFMDNLNDDIFNNCNYNNSNNTNTNNTNNTNNINSNVAAIFGSPDFRNMNFNFGINEFQKKIPFKTPCNNNNNNNTKRSRNSQTTPLLNDIFFNQRMMNNVGGNIQQQHQQQHQQQQQQNETCTGDDSENITTSSDGIYQANRQQHQISNSTTTAATTTIENNRDNLNPFENESETLRTICNMFDNQNDIPEEIKRNLLKNALKNHDKFTSKFFESLRNNVCCELHSILHQTTETQLNSQCLLEFFKDLYNYNVYKRSCSNGDSNNGSGGGVGGNVSGDGNGCDGGIAGTESNDDENNEFFDDTNRNGHLLQQAQSLSSLQHHHDQQQQQQHQQQISQQQSLSSLRNLNNTNNHHEQQFSKEQINNTDNNNYNNEIMNSLLNSQDLKRLAYKIMLESSPNDCGIISVEPNSDKDRKFTLKYEKISTTSQRSSPKIPNEIFRPDYELVTFIITNIRNNIRQQYIDDVTIKRISQLILSSFENYILQESSIYQNHEQQQQQQQQQQSCSFQIDHNLISTKELYRRMKSFKIRNRDIFLSRLETYLQTLFVIKVTNDDNLLINNVNLVNDKNISITGGGGGAFGGGGGGCGGVIKKDDTIENRSDLNLSLNYNAENVRKFSQINNNNHNNNTNNTNNTNKSNKSFVREDELTINDINSDNNKTEQIESQNSSTIFFRNSPIYHHLSSDTSLNVVTNGSVPQSQHPQQPQQPQQPPTATIKIEKDQLTPTNLMNNSMNNIMNEDLAEADQICSSSNNVSSNANNDDNDDNNDNNDGNYSINKQQQQQQNNNSNFSLSYDLPSSSSSLTTNQNHSKQICRQQLNRYLETVENCLNHRHQHYPQNNIFNNIYNHHENDYNICTEDDIQNLVTNYSNFIRSETTSNNNNNNNSNALLTQLSLSDYNNRAEEEEDEDDEIEQQQQHKQSQSQQQQQQQQHYNNHDNETIENVSEYFKKYYNGTCQNDDGQRISVVIGENCNDDDEDEDGGGGIKIKRYNNVYDKEIHVENVKDEIVECSSSSECDNIKMRINENIIINDHDDIIETNIHDNDNAEDDNNDHAQQFMMTDAACALVFPMVPMNVSGAGATVGAATVTKTNTENDSIDLLRQSHRYQNSSTIINCSQTDNSSNNTAAGQDYITLGAITFINNDNNGNTSNKRNSSSIP